MIQPKRRFPSHHASTGEALTLAPTHPASVNGHTLFPSTVVAAEDSPRLLVSGVNSRKIGDRVTKGAWKGFPIFTLTLEERATCPRSCHHWQSCMGNNMHFARRHKHGPEFEKRLVAELAEKQRQYPAGFVVRAHILGDFYSTGYVNLWNSLLEIFPALRVFGYTAWPRESLIGRRIKLLTDLFWDRFAVRFSGREAAPQGAMTIFSTEAPEGVVVCPAQTDKTQCCASCGLCWEPNFREKAIAFIAHGKKVRKSREAA